MTNEQEGHLHDLQAEVCELMERKYRKGAMEHDSDLLDMPSANILDEAIEEVIDLAVYLLTLKAKLK